ncbi:glycosyltransferase [Vibrio sp. FJH11]
MKDEFRPGVVLLVDDMQQTAGTEILTINLANEFSRKGYKVNIVSRGERIIERLADKLEESVKVFNLNISGRSFLEFIKVKPITDARWGNIKGVIAMTSNSAFLIKAIPKNYRKSSPLLIYALTPHTLLHRKTYGSHIETMFLLKSLPNTNLVFMNDGCKSIHQSEGDRDYSSCSINPIPVKLLNHRELSEPPKEPLRVLTISRIEPIMKGYLFHLPKIIEQFSLSTDVKLEIYGNGTDKDEQELRKKIKELNLPPGSSVNFLGPIDHKDITKVLEDAWVYIGMGTTVIEASSMGVPSIVATAYNENGCSVGYYKDMKFGDVGESVSTYQNIPISKMLDELLTKDVREYKELSNECYINSLSHSPDKCVERFESVFKNAKTSREILINWWVLSGSILRVCSFFKNLIKL